MTWSTHPHTYPNEGPDNFHALHKIADLIILVLYMPSPLHWSRYICNMLSRVTYMWYTWMLSSLPYCSCIYTNKLSVYMLNCILYLQLILLWKVHCNVNFVDIDACCPVLVCMVLFDLSYVVAAYFIPPPPPPPVPLDFLLSIKAFQQTDVKCVLYMSPCVRER